MASLGEQLKIARRFSNRSLEDISRDTSISKRYLEALEENRYDVFPSSAYARGFLSVYAKHIGLDSRAIATQYDRLLDTNTFRNTAHRRKKQRVIRKRVIMLLFTFLFVVASLLTLILKRS